jgi:hypothetical protein
MIELGTHRPPNGCDVTGSDDEMDFGVWSLSYAKPKLMFWSKKGF